MMGRFLLLVCFHAVVAAGPPAADGGRPVDVLKLIRAGDSAGLRAALEAFGPGAFRGRGRSGPKAEMGECLAAAALLLDAPVLVPAPAAGWHLRLRAERNSE